MDASTKRFRLDDGNRLQESPRRSSRACVACHVRKVRCDVSAARPQCSNCQRDDQDCQLRVRQPKRAARQSAAAPPKTSPEWSERSMRASVLAASGVALSSAPYQHGYMQRASFMGPGALAAEDGHEPDYAKVVSDGSSVSRQICDLQEAYSLPSRALQQALFENFWNYCYPWDPIIEKSQVIDMPEEKVSHLLLQAIFLGGSRLSAASLHHVNPHDFYLRAKALFWTDQERNPMTKLIAVSLLHWWNPHGPELVSTNTSTHWNRVAVSLAMQMGLNSAQRKVPDESLRRKVWWSLVARDCLISAAHGRPQAINLDYCDVPRPTLEDFPPWSRSSVAPVFIAYVDLAIIVGRFVNYSIRKVSMDSQVLEIGQLLQHWIQTLPPALHLSLPVTTSSQHSVAGLFEARQLNITYYAAVAMLYRARSYAGPFPVAAALAGSTIAAIFEELLARDQVRHLGPVYTFYLLVASIALLSCHRYHDLWEVAQEDLSIISHAQEEMKQKWPSALGSIRSFGRMYDITVASTQDRMHAVPSQQLNSTEAILLKDVDVDSCRLWKALGITANTTFRTANTAVEFQAIALPSFDTGDPSGLENSDMPIVEHDWSPMLLDEQTWQLDDGFFGGHLFWDELPNDGLRADEMGRKDGRSY